MATCYVLEMKNRTERAADEINATQISPRRWAYYADEVSRWFVCSSSDLAELCDYIDSDDREVARSAYSHWCAGSTAREMPVGWEVQS